MSVILKTTSSFLARIMLLISVLLLLRGHNYPGGGFIGALVAASSIALYTLAFNLKVHGFNYWGPKVIATGLLCLLLGFVIPMIQNESALTGLWVNISLLGEKVKLGTPLLFDFGIFFLISGSLSWMITELEDKES